MGEKTTISWTDHTFNPWWGCQKVSPGCEHCYAETFSKRVGQKVWGPTAERRFFGDKHWAEPVKWNRAAADAGVRRRVFCASMADVFEDRPELEDQRGRLYGLIEATPMLDWLLLTKRPENIRGMFPSDWISTHPKQNVWLGTTAEDQTRFDARWPIPCEIPAKVHFISAEPLLGPLRLMPLEPGDMPDWIIVGGESGHGARTFDIAWARSILRECRISGTWFFLKQLGQNVDNSDQPDGGLCSASIRGKGDDPAEWPTDLQVQEIPFQ